jgi:hypothetical protein
MAKQNYNDLKSLFYDPLTIEKNYHNHLKTISPYQGRLVSYPILRRVSEKAWILNVCIQNIIRKIRPFLKPVSTSTENRRGFRISKSNTESYNTRVRGLRQDQTIIHTLENFFLNTGDAPDVARTDDLDKYVSKIIRDICQLDQIATELQRTLEGEVCAFWAVDPASVETVIPSTTYSDANSILYIQVIDTIPYAYYTREDLIFDCMNPRTDINHAGYGYSLVEQAIDLITSSINTFAYNAGFFTENKLPRGILLLNGDADTEEIEEIEDYITDIMSGSPTSQWRIPIIPSGSQKSGEGNRKLEWVNLQGTNREMEFQTWFDLQLSGVVALFGASLEDLGLHSQKSQPMIGADNAPKIEASKSLVLGDMLGFLQKHFNQILKQKEEGYSFEFVGYEYDDPKASADIDKAEVDTYKSIDEKRIEKGLEPFSKKWSQVPLSPQVVQMVMAEEGESESPTEEEEEWEDRTGKETVEKSLPGRKGKEVIRIVI